MLLRKEEIVQVIVLWTMKNEMFYGHEYGFTSLDELQKSIEEDIKFYNHS